jgi:hypothetical protein
VSCCTFICGAPLPRVDGRRLDPNRVWFGLAKSGLIDVAIDLIAKFKLDGKSALCTAAYRAFSAMCLAIAHGQVEFVRRAARTYSLTAADVLIPGGDMECDWRFACKSPAMMDLLATELGWLTRDLCVAVDVEENMIAIALQVSEDDAVWRKFKELGVTAADVEDVSQTDNVNPTALDACALVFGHDVIAALNSGKARRRDNGEEEEGEEEEEEEEEEEA